MKSIFVASLLASTVPVFSQIIIIPTRTKPGTSTTTFEVSRSSSSSTQTSRCTSTKCVDYVNACHQTYGGCYPFCSGYPQPTYTDPYSCSVSSTKSTSVPASTTSVTSTKPSSSSTSIKTSNSTSSVSSTLATSTKPSTTPSPTASPTSSIPTPSSTLVAPNLQCGGIGIDGFKQCVPGYVCTQINSLFWQCQPSGGGGFPGGPGSDPDNGK